MDYIKTLIAFTLLGLVACNQPGDSANRLGEQFGQFIDSAVGGIEYQSGSIHGITSSDGSFRFLEGETITFFIGDIVLGNGVPSDVMSPLDIVDGNPDVSDDQVLNIARFLQTLDTDNDPSNGISISDFQREQALGKSIDFNVSAAEFENNGNVQVIVAELTASNDGGPQLLVSAFDAQSHLSESLGLEPPPEPVPALSIAELQSVCNTPVTTSIIDPYAYGEIIVGFNASISEDDVSRLLQSFNLTWSGTFNHIYPDKSFAVVYVPSGYELSWIQIFETLCYVYSANPNYIVSIPFYPGTGDCSIAC